jgi:Ser/Thr protein kinase RdoA (MazF antagonist)
MRRLRKLARAALESYGLTDSKLTYLCYDGNIIYRVDNSGHISKKEIDESRLRNRYVLRVHMDYHSTEAIRSELQWLSALRRDTDLKVPEPVPTIDGELVTEKAIPGAGLKRKCSLLRWLGGRFFTKTICPAHVRAWGRLMAQLHEHASNWQRPDGFTRRHRDWDGMFGDAAGFEFPAAELWEAIPKPFRKSFEQVARWIKQVTGDLGKGSDAYGLVHADLDVNTNILYKAGEARAIDFDDCCFAYWLHDIAFALGPWQGITQQHWVQQVFLEGYAEVRFLPDKQLKYLDLFMAAYNANLMLWMIDWWKLSPRSDMPMKQINKYGNNLLRYGNDG